MSGQHPIRAPARGAATRSFEQLNQLGSGVALYEAVDDGEDFVFLDFNPAAERIDQMSRDQVVGRRVTDVFLGVREFGLLEVMRRVWRTGVMERHPVSLYSDGRISGWRDNQVFRLPSGEIVALYEDRTAEKEAQARVHQLAFALAESEHRFRSTFEQAAVGMAHIGLDGRFLRINDKLCEITGYSRPELQALTFQDITHPEDLDADVALAGELWDGRIPHYRIAKRYLKKDGAVVWVNLTASAVRDESGRPEYGIAVVEDITAQKEAERLLASEELQRMALSAAKAGAWECEVESGEQIWSPEMYEIFGLDPAARPPTFPQWLEQCVHVEDRARFAAVTDDSTPEAERDFQIDFRAHHPEKGQRWLVSLGRLVRGADGRLRQCYGLNLDITERRRMEEALRTSETRLRMAMAAGQIGIWEWDIGSDKVHWSDDLTRIVQAGSEPAGRSSEAYRQTVHPEDRPRVEAARQQALRGEGEYNLEFRVLTEAGEVRWTEARGVVVAGPDGRPERMIGIDMDITAHKASEARQAMLTSELNHRVKNLLATVDAVARSTLRTAPTLEAFGRSFSARLQALARGADLLVRSDWGSVDMAELLSEALGSFGPAVRLVVPARSARLPAKAALGLNLILHELATNAAKYGGLSTPEGGVSIACGISDETPGQVVCRWREHGGPVVRAPQTKGFGSVLINLSARHDLRGEAVITYAPDGLECVLRFPADIAPNASPVREPSS